MPSTFSGLNTVMRGLTAQQVALNTVGHNVSNANTDGYSRQSVNLVAAPSETIYGSQGAMQVGTGVTITSVTRIRDAFMDSQMWKENSTLGSSEQQQTLLAKIEGVFQEPSDTGIQTVLTQFATAWQTLATNASDDSARIAVRQRGVELVDAVQHSASQLTDQLADINSSIEIKVNDVNKITENILALNKQISYTEQMSGGASANDLRDQRDVLVDQLSSLINVNVTEDAQGNYRVQSGSLLLVDANSRLTLSTRTDYDPDFHYAVTEIDAGSFQNIQFSSGELNGLQTVRDNTILGDEGYLSQLDTVSQFLLRDFNAIHRAGYGTDNDGTATVGTDRNFFGDAAVNYGDASAAASMESGDWLNALKVNSELFETTTGLAKIAAKTSADQGNASGDNAVKLFQSFQQNVTDLLPSGLAALPGGDVATLGKTSSLNSFYASMIGGLGVKSQNAQRLMDNQQTLVAQIENWRSSTAGVNMDEEMTNMIRFQQGYNSSARVVTTMNDMLDKLINEMVR
ncbi:MAG: flagellar hook-associated protein FlgK [Firmicutes bacterium]|nr:flagellar hook-associated protein FlgK [Bacillota bacterium]